MKEHRLRHRIARGFRENLAPGIVLWCVALGLVLVYFFVPATRAFFERIAALKTRGGYAFAAVSTAICGGLLPFLYLLGAHRIPRNECWKQGLFYILFWAYKGMEVDAFYRLQGLVFGDTGTAPVIIKKVLVDQFIYNPFWAAPSLAVIYAWKDGGFSAAALRQAFSRDLFTFTIPAVLFSTWFVWAPTVAIIYSLPVPLQVPLFNVVLCFWVLALNILARHQQTTA
ncbi:MAG: hypothetical protein EOM20_21075 [Spartobacteria bacterium]|nr:hypothetical protein [Spartobacteria bacterium]